jgi:hypothetical protein
MSMSTGVDKIKLKLSSPKEHKHGPKICKFVENNISVMFALLNMLHRYFAMFLVLVFGL